jgi:hypothetical protein
LAAKVKAIPQKLLKKGWLINKVQPVKQVIAKLTQAGGRTQYNPGSFLSLTPQ